MTLQEAVENARADVAASPLGAEWMRERAISACTITYTDAREYNLPQMAGGAAKCREDIRAIPLPTHADLLAAALLLPEIKALVEAALAMTDAWQDARTNVPTVQRKILYPAVDAISTALAALGGAK